MDVRKFVSAMHDAFEGDPATATQPRDRRFVMMRQEVKGFCSANILAALNLAVRHCGDDEVYFEVGSLNGLSLYGAGAANDCELIAVDNFSQQYEHVFGLIDGRPAFYHHLAALMGGYNVRFFERDCWTFIGQELAGVLDGRKVGAYFFDGPHDYESQYRAIAEMEERGFFADEAVVIVDDTNNEPVQRANQDWIGRHSNFRMLFDLPSPGNGTARGWWNGLQILGRGVAVPVEVNG